MRVNLNTRVGTGNSSGSTETELYRQHIEQREHCGHRLGINAGTVDRMVQDFIASHGGVTVCPTAYAALSHQYDV